MNTVKTQLERLLGRAVALHGITVVEGADGQLVDVDADKAYREFLTSLCAFTPDVNEQSKMLLDAFKAGGKSPEMLALNAVRMEHISNYIPGLSTIGSMFFQTDTWKLGDQPVFINETEREARISVISEDGTPDKVRVVKSFARTNVPLHLVASDEFVYSILDLYRGRIDGIANKTLRIAESMAFKLDRVLFTLLNQSVATGGCFGAFSFEQGNANLAKRIYVPHSGIDTTNLASTNDIVNGTTAGPTGTRFTVRYYDAPSTTLTGFRPAVLLAIEDYANMAGPLCEGGRLVPTGEIVLPTQDIINILSYMTLTTTAVQQTEIQKQVQENGYTSLFIAGRMWKFIGDVTLPTGTCYPRFNQLPGRAWTVPEMDGEFTETDNRKNLESRWARKAYGALIMSQWRPRACRIKYIA